MNKPKYSLAMIITAVQCAGCNQALAPKAPIMTRSKDDLTAAAELLHTQSGIICPQAKLIVIYQPCFVDEAIFPEIDNNTLQQSAAAGGN